MLFRLAADAVLLLHLGFILFALLGAALALRWRWMPWLHLPALAWGATVEFMGWICPLTPLENALRRAGGAAGYAGSFVERYLVPLIYPGELTREWQFVLGGLLLVINVAIYCLVWRRRGH